jgi:hypothetical protein
MHGVHCSLWRYSIRNAQVGNKRKHMHNPQNSPSNSFIRAARKDLVAQYESLQLPARAAQFRAQLAATPNLILVERAFNSGKATATSRTPSWLPSGWECQGRHLSRGRRLLRFKRQADAAH